MIEIGRLGYERSRRPIMAYGWRHLWGPFWWFSPRLERKLLETLAGVLNIKPRPTETNAALRERLSKVWKVP